jgi:hypothetical protein
MHSGNILSVVFLIDFISSIILAAILLSVVMCHFAESVMLSVIMLSGILLSQLC